MGKGQGQDGQESGKGFRWDPCGAGNPATDGWNRRRLDRPKVDRPGGRTGDGRSAEVTSLKKNWLTGESDRGQGDGCRGKRGAGGEGGSGCRGGRALGNGVDLGPVVGGDQGEEIDHGSTDGGEMGMGSYMGAGEVGALGRVPQWGGGGGINTPLWYQGVVPSPEG